MNINELTLGQIKEIQSVIGNNTPVTGNSTFMKVGDQIMLRTIKMIYTGRIKEISDTEILLEDAAWIADTGRFNESVRTAIFEEVEPYPKEELLIIFRAGLLEAIKIPSLPTEVK